MTQAERWYSIAPEVFSMFPGYIRGVVLAYDVSNGDSPPELTALLRKAEESARAGLDPDKPADHPRLVSWREAYRALGAKPAKFRPSIEAMARRVLKDQALPSISRLVDIGNIVSLSRLAPAGGHALDEVRGEISLRPAKGDESFTPFGSDQEERPEPGEIVFVEGRTVLTRRWTWRQANHTLVTPDTRSVEFNVDGLPPVDRAEVEAACLEIMDLVGRFCGGRMRYEIMTPENPRILLDEK